MELEALAREFNFLYEEKSITIKTDFEKIKIHTNLMNSRYSTEGENLIRFLNGELLDEFEGFVKIPPAFFLPTHIMNEFLGSIGEEEIIPKLKKYYPSEKYSYFTNGEYLFEEEIIIPNKQKATFGTSLYGTDNATISEQIEAAKQILKLNSMKNYKIALGYIKGNICLLERGMSDKEGVYPKSRHYNLWKFCEDLCGGTFEDIAAGFEYVD